MVRELKGKELLIVSMKNKGWDLGFSVFNMKVREIGCGFHNNLSHELKCGKEIGLKEFDVKDGT